jgi:hypothetical protein
VDAPERPDRLVLDLDPPDGTPVAELRAVARRIRDHYREAGLTPFVQATGGRGFHVVAPLDAKTETDVVLELSRVLADRVAADDPDRLTTAQRKGQARRPDLPGRQPERVRADVRRAVLRAGTPWCAGGDPARLVRAGQGEAERVGSEADQATAGTQSRSVGGPPRARGLRARGT